MNPDCVWVMPETEDRRLVVMITRGVISLVMVSRKAAGQPRRRRMSRA
jgi:hypothetical protein